MDRRNSHLAALLAAVLLVAASCAGGGSGNGDATDDAIRADVDVVATTDTPAPPDGSDVATPDDSGPDVPPGDVPGEDVVAPPALWTARTLGAGDRDVTSAWCAGPGDCLAVGEGGLVLQRQGAGWLPLASGTTADLFGVAGFSDGGAIAVGADATVLRLEDGVWTNVCGAECRGLLPDETAALHAVWGTSGDLFFVAGDGGTVLRWDGTAWHHEPTGITSRLLTMWGDAATDLYVGGERGKVLHRVGATWTATDILSSSSAVYGIWAVDANDVWAVGSDGRVLRRQDGGQWITMATNDPQDRTLRAVWGAAWNRVWAVGEDGVVLFWNGDRWNLQDVAGPNYKGANFLAIAAAVGDGSAVAIDLLGEGGAAIGRNADATWTDRDAGPTQAILDLWGPAGAAGIVAVGEDGVILEGLLPGASSFALVPSRTTVDLRGVGGSAPDDVWAVGADGTTLRRGADGWEPVDAPAAQGAGLNAVYVVGPGQALAVGDVGTALRWDGDVWNREASGVLVRIEAVHGRGLDDAWAVTEDGRVLRRDGGGWETIDQPVGSALRDVWQAPDGTVWVAGDNGVVLRGGADGFRIEGEASGSFLYGLHGVATDGGVRLVAVGWAGLVLTGVDGELAEEASGTFQELRAVHVWDSGAVALGRGGVLVQRTRPW